MRHSPVSISPDRKLSLTLGLAVAILASLGAIALKAHDAITDSAVWRAKTDIRLQRLESVECKCSDVWKSYPPDRSGKE